MNDFDVYPVSDQFHVTALWRPRGESPEGLAARWIAMIERLAKSIPFSEQWFQGWEPRFKISKDNRRLVSDNIRGGVHKLPGEDADPSFGYHWHARNAFSAEWGSRYVSVSAHAGGRRSAFFESIALENDAYHEADPAILNYGVFRETLLAIADSFEPDEAIAYPARIQDLWPRCSANRPRLRAAWMTFVAARYANLVSPPLSALAERRPDGSLFMAATTQRFSMNNPDHVRVANEIAASAPTFENIVPDSGKFGQIDVPLT